MAVTNKWCIFCLQGNNLINTGPSFGTEAEADAAVATYGVGNYIVLKVQEVT